LRPLRFLTDEHISPLVAREARRKCPGISITALHEWRDGCFLGSQDEVFLPEASKDGLTFVSYDQRTIRPLLKRWAESGVQHGGLVFVDEKTIAPQDFGRLVASLCLLWRSERRASWQNRVVYLVSPAESS
jgi:hypothetical protein